MTDTLTALEQVNAEVTKLVNLLNRIRSKLVLPEEVRPLVRSIAELYFGAVHQQLSTMSQRAGLVDEIEHVLQTTLSLTTAIREKSAYIGQVNELRPYLQEAMIWVMKSRGTPRLVMSETEKGILSTLTRMRPATAVSYEQVLRDIAEGQRISWRGPATELREVLREVIDHLAPDDQVMAAQGFQLEKERTRPTQKQKVRFILKARNAKRNATDTATGALETFEEGIAVLARSTYDRGAGSTHSATDGTELRKLKGYVDAILVELLYVG